jgi:hypothetical protein
LQDRTRADFAAIGSGNTAALASLSVDDYNRQRHLAEAVYHVCAAKFMAEASRAPGVGKATLVLCMRPDGKTKWIFKTHIEWIRRCWDEHGRPRVPSDEQIEQVIQPILTQQEWTDV